ncbi:MAG TPA: hypothetical protein DCG57_07285 [Candidatus Riflebacteria bacterium]|jgi:hypothetical protein|nr:hypothetical protein [Candidatus Riflebacteria bacterium]
MSYNQRHGITLTEIMLALFILSAAFIPIIAVMSTGVRGTQKDETILRGVQLAQKTLNTALQLPFGDLVANRGGAGAGPWVFGAAGQEFNYATASTNLRLGKVLEGTLEYTLVLEISDIPFNFSLSVHNPMARNIASTTPAGWGWQAGVRVPRVGDQTGLFNRYVLTATWFDRGLSDGSQKTYRLVSYKARLHEL